MRGSFIVATGGEMKFFFFFFWKDRNNFINRKLRKYLYRSVEN